MTQPFRFAVQSYAPESPAQWRDQARRAESLGFSAFHLADHVIGPGPALDATGHPVQVVAAIPAMAVAAEATERIRIGCRVLCVDYRNPVVLAKELATLDWFSGGRLEIGLGAGWLANEYEAIGVPFDPPAVRIDRLVEVIGLLRACFGEGQVDVSGRHVHAVGFEGLPKPAQPAPPLMIGGGSPRVLRLAGREADIVSLNFDNSSGRLGPGSIAAATADRTAEKIEWIRAGAGDRFDDLELEIGAYFTVVTDDEPTTVEGMAGMFGLTPDSLRAHPHVLIGSVEQICDTLQQRRDELGISYVTFGASAMEAVAPIVARLTGT